VTEQDVLRAGALGRSMVRVVPAVVDAQGIPDKRGRDVPVSTRPSDSWHRSEKHCNGEGDESNADTTNSLIGGDFSPVLMRAAF
jgi:hypothetical protein